MHFAVAMKFLVRNFSYINKKVVKMIASLKYVR